MCAMIIKTASRY